MTRFLVLLRRLGRALWLRVALFAALAFLAVIVAALAAPLVPEWIEELIDAGAVIPVLEILASSMLAVSTFSLGTMVQSHRAAAQAATPRVLDLMIQDGLTQNVLGIFIGAFVYALTALILLQAGFTGGAPLVLGVTLAVTGAVVLALVRWIAHLARLGTVQDALDRAEAQAKKALTAHRRHPALGASAISEQTVAADHVRTLTAPRSGTLQVIDVKGLAECSDGPVWVLRRPGQQVLKGAPLLQLAESAPDEEALLRCFVIGDNRTFEQDPAFAITVLSEIASRALSPGVNDPGTAIATISRLERLLWDWALADPEETCRYPQVFVHPWTAPELVEAAFAPIARDGAGMLEVATQLIDTLDALGQGADPSLAEAARAMSPRARAHAEAALTLEDDVARLPKSKTA
ncbi:DUF2254 domain-containing protein [Cereibacter sphaeroides]|nr:DUF2254 domain-containing protein [Cereibacter sphaeroides]